MQQPPVIEMPGSSIDNWSASSTYSGRTTKSRKSLAERMRELGFNFRSERTFKTLRLQQISLKFEESRPSDYLIMTPKLNLNQIVYFQPDIKYDKNDPENVTFEFEDFRKNSMDPNEIRRISDIPVISYKPAKTMVFRKRKKHSSIISTVERILHRHRSPRPTRDPSEESIFINQNTEPEKTINDLPESILLKIFTYFNRQERNLVLSRICKLWNNILNDPIFWNELMFTGSRISKKIIIHLIRKHPSVKELSLTSVPEVVDILQELCRCNHGLTLLRVRYCILSSPDFARIILHVISCCVNLEHLDLEGMCFKSDRFFLELGRLKNLKSINLTGNKLIKSQNLITLSLNCRNLQELKILDIFFNNEQGSPLQDADLMYIALHLQKNLETLEIDMQKLKVMSYQAILNCTKLVNLTLKNCLYLGSETFRQFTDLKNLKKLELTRGINLRSQDFQYLFASEKMSKIEDLDVDGCWRVGELGLQAICSRLSSLKSLSIKSCKTIEEHHLVHLSRCPELTYLNIAHTGVQLESPISLYNSAKKLQTLVIDSDMYKKTTMRKLKKFFPSLKIILSFSEFQKVEKVIQNY